MHWSLITLPPTGLTVGGGDSLPGVVGVARGDGGLPVDGGAGHLEPPPCETLAVREYGLGYVEVYSYIHLSSLFDPALDRKLLNHLASLFPWSGELIHVNGQNSTQFSPVFV